MVRGCQAPHTSPPPAQAPGLPSTLHTAARAGRMAHGSAPGKKPPAEEEFEDFQTEGAPCSLHRLGCPQPRAGLSVVPAAEWTAEQVDPKNPALWASDWDDDTVADEFCAELRKVLEAKPPAPAKEAGQQAS